MKQPGRWGAGIAFGLLMGTVPVAAQEHAPEIAPGGTVVLRGATPTPPHPGTGSPVTTSQSALAPANGLDATGFDRRFDRRGLDASGFDRRFDRSGLTPQ